MKKTYSERLLDPRWQKKRLEIFERDGFTCVCCGDKEMTLHVHHLYYCKGREPWEYPNFALSTYCKSCHANAEEECRDDDGNFVPTQWEQAVEWLMNGQGGGGEGAVGGGLWDMGAQLGMARDLGANHSQGIGAMLNAITDFRMSHQK